MKPLPFPGLLIVTSYQSVASVFPTKLNAEQLKVLRQLVEDQPDVTLSEMQERLQPSIQVLISIATLDRMVRLRLKLSFKRSLHPTLK